MKTLLYLITAMCTYFSASAQLQNLDFENWDATITTNDHSNKPTHWNVTNGIQVIEDSNFVHPPSTNAQQNNYGLQLSVWYNHTKDAAIQKAAISTRPAALTGWYQYKENLIWLNTSSTIQKDTAMISVHLTKYNPLTNSSDIIGKGILEIGDSTSVYTNFLLEIDYTSTAIPDSITVILDPSLVNRYPNRGYNIDGTGRTSYFLIDNLSLLNSLSIDEIDNKKQIKLYPNPTKDFIFIDDIEGNITIWDASGRKVQSFNNVTSGKIDVSNLNSGTYLLQVINDKKKYYSKFIKK